MAIYNLNKTATYDTNGRILNNYIHNNLTTVNNITIRDNGFGTIENMCNLFRNLSNVRNINLINFNTSKVIGTQNSFFNCKNLINISNFNTSHVINMHGMFEYCYNLINIPKFDTSNVTNMSYMFQYCYDLTNIPNINTNNVINMSNMFCYCYNLINVPNFNTSNVFDMCGMFSRCYNLTNIPNFNTSNVTNIVGMFSYCNNLTNIPNLNFSNVTESFSYLFENCANLPIEQMEKVIKSINVEKITNYLLVSSEYLRRPLPGRHIFKGTQLNTTSIVPNQIIEKTSDISYTFSYCHNLIDISSLNT